MEILQSLGHWLLVLVVFIVMISLLVAAHEWGHYLFAKWFKMGVEEFAIGFGKPRLLVWKRKTYELPVRPGEDAQIHGTSHGMSLEGGEIPVERELVEREGGTVVRETTDFTIRPWPIGGFVRIKGMIPEEDGSETKVAGGFYSKPPWQRLLVLFAGPLFSVVTGILILIPVYTVWGVERNQNVPVVAAMGKDTPAYTAGLRPGDRVTSIGGKQTETFYDLVTTVQANPGRSLPLTWEREGRAMSGTITPQLRETTIWTSDMQAGLEVRRAGQIGIAPPKASTPLPLGEAVEEALRAPIRIVDGIARIFVRPSNFERSVGGPLTMVAATSALAQRGVEYVIWLSAMLSISVGIMNLLPVPPLDGGQMVIAFAEMFRRGRRLSYKLQGTVSTIGFALVLTLMVSVLVVDVRRFTPLGGQKREKAPEMITQEAPQTK